MKTLLSIIGFAAFTFAGAGLAAAQSTPSPAASASPSIQPLPTASPSPVPSPSPSPSPKTLQFSGFADAAYSSRISNVTQKFVSGANARVFDVFDRQPDLQNLNVQAVLTAGQIGGKVELSAGTDADIIAAYPAAFNGFDVTQAYLTFTQGKVTIQGGKYETLAGAEVIEGPSNSNFSRSILFGYAVPFTHTGGRITYAPTPQVSFIAGLNQGWDVLRDTNAQLTSEYGVAYNSSKVSLTAQGYSGFEQITNYPISTAGGQRTLIDAVGTIHATSALTFTVNYDRGKQDNAPLVDGTGLVTNPSGSATWSGFAGYLTYAVNPRLTGSVRYEGFRDNGGYRTGFDQLWREGTATVGWALTPAVTLRAEYRHDVSDHPVFLRAGGLGDTQNSTVALEGIVKF